MVARALDAGINFFDTADVYSYGRSEEVLGAALKEVAVGRDKVVIATKVRGAMSEAATAGTGDVNNVGLSRQHIFSSVEDSLRRLGTDYIDLYQVHGWDVLTPAGRNAARARRPRASGQGALHRLLKLVRAAFDEGAGPGGRS